MKFTVSLSDFQEAVNKTLPAIPPKSTLPVLEHLNFELTDNKLKIISTDQEITIRTELEISDGEDGKVLVPGRRLNDILRALGKTESITINTNPENYEIDIETPFGKYEMKGLSPEEYLDLPELFQTNNSPDGEADISVTISQDEVIRLADKTGFAVSNDEFRPAMTGVLFQFRQNYLNAVSTDSYRLVKATYHADGLPDDVDVIIPSRTMDLLKKADDEVIFSFIKNNDKITHVKFQIDNTVYISRIIDEKFPPYESVIPDNNTISVKVDKSQILSAIKRVSIFTNDIRKQIKLNLSQNNLTITGEDEDSGTKADETLDCTLSGEPIVIGFNYKYLDDAVNHTSPDEDGNVLLTFSEPNRPALIMPDENTENLLMLIMPVRLS